MKRRFLALLFLFLILDSFAQKEEIATDTIAVKEKKWEIALELYSRYIWRGQSWGGDYAVVQPAFTYNVSESWSIGVWATTNFKKDYFYSDGLTPNRGYHEIDFGVTYQINDFMNIQIWDYYWPTLQKLEGTDNRYFNYGPSSVKTVDATMSFDFSEGYRYPFNATISTLIAGNDYRYNRNDDNPIQNFTTYIGIGYTFENVLHGLFGNISDYITIETEVGAVLNNQAEYYTYADYDKISLVNLTAKANREFTLDKGVTMPLSLSFTHNASDKNTEAFGRNFLIAGIAFSY